MGGVIKCKVGKYIKDTFMSETLYLCYAMTTTAIASKCRHAMAPSSPLPRAACAYA